MEVSREQLKRYADVICQSQTGLGAADIAASHELPPDLVSDWIKNFRDLDSAYAAVA